MDLVRKEDITDVEDLDIWLENAMPGKHWMERMHLPVRGKTEQRGREFPRMMT